MWKSRKIYYLKKKKICLSIRKIEVLVYIMKISDDEKTVFNIFDWWEVIDSITIDYIRLHWFDYDRINDFISNSHYDILNTNVNIREKKVENLDHCRRQGRDRIIDSGRIISSKTSRLIIVIVDHNNRALSLSNRFKFEILERENEESWL